MENNNQTPTTPTSKIEDSSIPASPVTADAGKESEKLETTSKPSTKSGAKKAFASHAKSTTTDNAAVTPKQSSSWWIRLGLLLSILLAGAAIGASYWLYMQLMSQQASQKDSANQLQAQQQLTDNLSRELKNELSQSLIEPNLRIDALETMQRSSAQVTDKIAALVDANKQIQERVAVIAKRSPSHWMSAEAEYLVRMAGRKLWLENDPKTAIGLLEAADERIDAMKNPALMSIRHALDQDIENIKSIKTIDVTSSVYTLDTLIKKLDTLSVQEAKTRVDVDIDTKPMTDSIDDWQTNLANTWHELTAGLVTVRKRTTDLEPLLSATQHWNLVENIRSKLLQAQLALYRVDNKSYHQSLTFASKWIKQYFDLSAAETQQVLKSIEKLQLIKLEHANYNNFSSTNLIQQLIDHGDVIPEQETEL